MSGKRVPTRSLVTIGQIWRRTGRLRAERYEVRITQVHRGQDREVEAVVVYGAATSPPAPPPGKQLRIKFPELRTKYKLIEQ